MARESIKCRYIIANLTDKLHYVAKLMKALRNKIVKAILAADHFARTPSLAKTTLANLYNARIISKSPLTSIAINDVVGNVTEVRLVNFMPEQGNVTPFELLCLCMMVKAFSPRQALELGTFNGNTTLQIAANLAAGATITTLDLPFGNAPADANDEHDAQLIYAPTRAYPRYLDSPYQNSVRQVYGDSLTTDFAALTAASPDFIFIDAGHSDPCVRNDTTKSIDVLAPGGCIVWHDYTQDWPDVFNYLNELGQHLPLKHIRGTNLVIYRDTKK